MGPILGPDWLQRAGYLEKQWAHPTNMADNNSTWKHVACGSVQETCNSSVSAQRQRCRYVLLASGFFCEWMWSGRVGSKPNVADWHGLLVTWKDILMQKRRNSIAFALGLRLLCITSSLCCWWESISSRSRCCYLEKKYDRVRAKET